MAAAYRYCEGDNDIPRELLQLQYIDRFGVHAVMGRAVLGAGEMACMVLVENVVRAYRSRAQAENWAAWAQSNPGSARLLAQAQEAANG